MVLNVAGPPPETIKSLRMSRAARGTVLGKKRSSPFPVGTRLPAQLAGSLQSFCPATVTALAPVQVKVAGANLSSRSSRRGPRKAFRRMRDPCRTANDRIHCVQMNRIGRPLCSVLPIEEGGEIKYFAGTLPVP